MFILGDHELEVKDIVICIISANSSLTQEKEYEVVELNNYNEVSVKNDEGWLQWYKITRFISKSDLRNININLI